MFVLLLYIHEIQWSVTAVFDSGFLCPMVLSQLSICMSLKVESELVHGNHVFTMTAFKRNKSVHIGTMSVRRVARADYHLFENKKNKKGEEKMVYKV